MRTLFPNLLHARSALPGARCSPIPRLARQTHSVTLSIPRTLPKSNNQSRRTLYTAGVGLGLTFLTYHSYRRPILCDAAVPRPTSAGSGAPPESMLNAYQLTFGTVCGICTGVFLKKGLRAIAFLLGGVFILMQVSCSMAYSKCNRLLRVWSRGKRTAELTGNSTCHQGLSSRSTGNALRQVTILHSGPRRQMVWSANHQSEELTIGSSISSLPTSSVSRRFRHHSWHRG
jgi:hypothetical protein